MNEPKGAPDRLRDIRDAPPEEREYDTIAWQIERFAERVERVMSRTTLLQSTEQGRNISVEMFHIVNFMREVRADIARRVYDHNFERPKFLLAAMEAYYRTLTKEASAASEPQQE